MFVSDFLLSLRINIPFVSLSGFLTILLLFYDLWFSGHEACGSVAPWAGVEPAPSAGEGEVLTAERPGKPTTNVLMHIPRRPSQAVSSKCGPSTSSRSTWALVRHTSSAPSPDPLGWKLWKWGPVLRALTNPPGDCETSKVWELLL